MTLTPRLYARLGAVLLVVLLFAGLRWHYIGVGEARAQAVFAEAEKQRLRDTMKAMDRAAAEGELISAESIASERKADAYADQLKQERRHVALTVSTRSCPSGIVVREPGRQPALASMAEPTANNAAPDSAAQTPHSPEPDVRLSADAVRLWNNALAGRDLPAAACGADGRAEGACAADAGIGLADAWDNQAENALGCRVDRERYRKLIVWLRTVQAAQRSQ